MSFGTQTITNFVESRRAATVKQADENPRVKEEFHAETIIRAPDDLELEVRPIWSLRTASALPMELSRQAEHREPNTSNPYHRIDLLGAL